MGPVYDSHDKRQANSQYLCREDSDFTKRIQIHYELVNPEPKYIGSGTDVMLLRRGLCGPKKQRNGSARTPLQSAPLDR